MTEEQRSMMCTILKRHGKKSEHFRIYKKALEVGIVIQFHYPNPTCFMSMTLK